MKQECVYIKKQKDVFKMKFIFTEINILSDSVVEIL